MKSRTVDTLQMPPGWLAEVRAAAEEEHRDAVELVREAVERYLSERRLFRPDEMHGKVARGLESLRRGEGLDGESVMAELIGELDAPERIR